MPNKPIIPVSEANYAVEAIGRLTTDNPIRRQAVAVLQGSAPDSIDPFCLVLEEGLADRWGELEVAAWALGRSQLEGEERERAGVALMETLEGSRRPRSTFNTFLKGWVRALLPGLGCVLLISAIEGPPGDPSEFFAALFVFSALLSWFFSPVSWFTRKGRRNAVRAAAAEALGHLRMPESVGGLAGALFNNSPIVRQAAAIALKESLPDVTEAHYGLIPARAMDNLGRALQHEDSQLVMLVLDGLAKIGTPAVIPHVQRLRDSARTTRARDAADDVIRILEQRRDQERHSGSLLRPSVSPKAAPETLLRPARSSGEAETETLLRPTNGAA